ncbi:peptidyl-tRNA hydrolase II [Boletus reticuloceps]|uniref:peptidyl-tRNA hydrolase n=1 Tax=Boletus reticuloceps TaxID=495285 RepID=A0A8I2Z3F4_9AGAM|nr:peptidyl-tRNA hydrolase II [Boletus reticuloceps]
MMDPQTTASTSTPTTDTSNPVPSQASNAEPLVMQIVVRRDLFDKEKWGVGPLMAQAAHAATAVLHLTRERQETIEYLADLRNMRKVSFKGSRSSHNDTGPRTVVLQTPDLSTLEKLTAALSYAGPSPIPHHLWTEQPEDIPTCIALAPNRKEKPIRKALDKSSCRLWQSD